jgi:DNA invertase Pin-like site-specific DNA recombinase
MRVGLYLRLSNDPGHDRLGVQRQEKEARRFCDQRGWEVAEVFEDDDRSAFSGKPRPAYQRMLEGHSMGDFGGIVAWHPDRLHRSPKELESFIDLIDQTKGTVATVQGGDYDLSTAAGRMAARVVGAVARHESEHKSERLRIKMAELVEYGKLTGGSCRRPFGYEWDLLTVREDEAEVIRELVRRYLAGESLSGLVNDLNRRGVATSTGGPWKRTVVRDILRSARIAGLREFRGAVVKAPWNEIITPEQHRRVVAHGDANAQAGRRAPRRYLLAGLVSCGRCCHAMTGHPVKRAPRYCCVAAEGGCNRTFVLAEPVEKLAEAVIFEVVDSPDFARRLARNDGRRPELHDKREAIEDRLSQLAEEWADGAISRAEWQAARRRLQEQLEVVNAQERRAAQNGVLDRWGEHSLRDAWPGLTLDQRRAIAAAVIAHVTVAPYDKHAPRRFDPRRITIERRL